MRLPLLVLPALLALGACATEPEPTSEADALDTVTAAPAAGLVADGAMARAAPAGGVSAAYLTIQNGDALPDTLVRAGTSAAGRVEIHRTAEDPDGLSTMTPVEGGLAVPAGATVTLEPGGLHVMLLDLQRDLVDGDTLSLDLEFSSGTRRTVLAPVRAVNGAR